MKIYILIRNNGYDGLDEPYDWRGFTDKEEAEKVCNQLNGGKTIGHHLYYVEDLDVK